nr:MAG TPA: minor tail protein [Caudoviricetes sp.]
MATKIGDVELGLVVNQQGFTNQLNGIQQKVMGFAKVLAGAFAVKKLIDFGSEAIKLGSDLNEVQNVVDVAFPKMSKQVDEFAKSAMYASGLSETMAKRYTGTFGAMSKAFGFSEQQAYEMSTALTSLAGDVASFYNISQDEAYTKLKSVFTGETETLKDLGVVMTQTALDAYAMANGFGKTTAEMSEAEKVALRFAFVQSQLALASGDFARTSDSWANQVRIMKLQFQSFMASVGQGLINLFTPVIQVLNFLLSKLLTVGNAFRALTELLTGKKSQAGGGIQETADAVGNLADNMQGAGGGAGDMADAVDDAGGAADKAGGAAKKAAKEMKSLMGFDKINKLSEPNDDSGGGGGGGGGGKGKGKGGGGGGGGLQPKGAQVDMGKIAEGDNQLKKFFEDLFGRIGELLAKFKAGFDAAFHSEGLERMKVALERIGATLQEIFTDPQVVQSFNDMLDKWAYALGQFTGAIASVGVGIGVFLTESIANALDNHKEQIKKALVNTMDATGDMMKAAGNIAQAIGDSIYKVLTSEGAVKIGEAIAGAFISLYVDIKEIGAKLGRDLMKAFETIITKNAPKLTEAFNTMLKNIAPIFKTVEKAVEDVGSMFKRVYDNSIGPLILQWGDMISGLVGTIIDGFNNHVNPILEKVGKAFEGVYKQFVKPMIDSLGNAISSIVEAISRIWTALEPLYNLLASALGPILGVIAGLLGGLLLAAIAGVSLALKGLFDFLSWIFDILGNGVTAIAEFADKAMTAIPEGFQAAWDGIVAIFGGIGQWFADRWNDIVTAFSDVATWFSTMFTNAWNSIVNVFKAIGQWFKDRWNDVVNALSNVSTWFGTMFKNAWSNIVNVFSVAGSWFSGIWGGIKAVFSGVVDFFRGIFQGAWNTITSIFSTIPNWFSNIFSKAWAGVRDVFSTGGRIFMGITEGILGTFKTVVNGIIGGINRVITIPFNGINGILDGIRGISVMGVSPFAWIGRISTPQIPMLAQGGFVKANTPQLAMIGDNKHYGEIVAPENKMLAMAREAARLSKDSNSSAEVVALLRQLVTLVAGMDLNIDGESVTRKIFDIANGIQQRTNQPLLDF